MYIVWYISLLLVMAANLQEEEEMVSGQRYVVETGQTQTAKGQVSDVR